MNRSMHHVVMVEVGLYFACSVSRDRQRRARRRSMSRVLAFRTFSSYLLVDRSHRAIMYKTRWSLVIGHYLWNLEKAITQKTAYCFILRAWQMIAVGYIRMVLKLATQQALR